MGCTIEADEWFKTFKGFRAFMSIFQDYKEHHKKYEIRWATAAEILKAYGFLFDVRSSGQVLTGMSREGYFAKRGKEEGHTGAALYRFPFPLPEVDLKSVANPINVLRGALLKRARIRNDFSIGDLSAMTGYGPSIIKKWEAGTYTMSPDAIRAVDSILGTNLNDVAV